MITLTFFKGDQTNARSGIVRSYFDLEALSDIFKKCKKGVKHSGYFVRGECEFGARNDTELRDSAVVVLDVDSGERPGTNAPSPRTTHVRLKELGLSHIIYTTHSHKGKAKNKYRVILETNENYTKAHIKNTVNDLLDMATLGIHRANEMFVWSQPWFMPTRSDPTDGLYEYYGYFSGHKVGVNKKVQENSAEEGEGEGSSSGDTLQSLAENIRLATDFHSALRKIAWMMSKDGVNKAMIVSYLESLMMNSVDIGSSRWQIRYDDIERTVSTALDKQDKQDSAVEMPEVKIFGVKEKLELPTPPGLMGILFKECYDGLLYQYKEVALVSVLGLIAGIAGRKFNVMEPKRSAVNMYLTVVAGTGFGKEGITNFISRAIRGSSVTETEGKFDSFIGPSSFTGGKAIFNAFKDARSRVCVMSEAGLMMKVKFGDVEGKTATLLDAYNVGHSDGYTKSHEYSSEDNSIGSLRAMAITIISESTPDQLMEAYAASGSLANGYLPRQMIFRIPKRKESINRIVNESIGSISRKRIRDLMETCAEVQSESDPKAIELRFSKDIVDDMWSYQDKYNKLSCDWEGIDVIKFNMATRIGIKAVRVAALLTIYNKKKDSAGCCLVGKEEWDYAKSLCDYEFSGVSDALGGLLSADDESTIMENAVLYVYEQCRKIIGGELKAICPDIRYRNKRLIPVSMVRQACRKNTLVRAIRSKDAVMEVIRYMASNNVCKLHMNDPLGGKSPRMVEFYEGIGEFIRSLSE